MILTPIFIRDVASSNVLVPASCSQERVKKVTRQVKVVTRSVQKALRQGLIYCLEAPTAQAVGMGRYETAKNWREIILRRNNTT